jgi:transposase
MSQLAQVIETEQVEREATDDEAPWQGVMGEAEAIINPSGRLRRRQVRDRTGEMVEEPYPDAHVLVDSQRAYGVTIVGPVAEDPSWQARAGEGFDKSQFLVDWGRYIVICPAGKQSLSWLPNTYPKNGMVWEARFACKDCTPCVYRSQCTKAKQEPRILGLQAREHYETLQAARQRQTTDAFRRQYAPRAGIEGTHEQAIRRCGVRRSRYLGLAKTHLQHLITATAINMVRVTAWLEETPRAKTRRSAFAALAA